MSNSAIVISIVEITILLVALASGIAAAALIGITTNQSENQCLLRATIKYDGDRHFTFTGSNYSRCKYCIIIHVIGVLLAFALIVYRILVIACGKYNISVIGRMVISVVFGVLTFLLIVEALLVAVGLKTFCNNLQDLFEIDTPCRDFQTSFEWGEGKTDNYFYDNLTKAEIASWISVITWLLLTVICIVTSCIIRKRNKSRAQIPLKEVPVST